MTAAKIVYKPKHRGVPVSELHQGYVYLVECNGIYKIGKAKDVKKRIAGLTTGNPYPIKIWGSYYVVNPERDEKLLHFILQEYRVRGEWFELPSEIATALKLAFGEEVSPMGYLPAWLITKAQDEYLYDCDGADLWNGWSRRVELGRYLPTNADPLVYDREAWTYA